MDRKFIAKKIIVVPILTLVMLLSQVTNVFAVSPNDVTSLMENSPNVVIEMYGSGQQENLVAMLGGFEKQDFTDVKPENWFYKSVVEARRLGLIKGVGNNQYAPQRTITNAEYLTVLVRLVYGEVEESKGGQHWATNYVQKAKELGIISANDEISLNAGITRQDMIAFTCRALGIEPADTSQIIFEDIKAEDAGYINAAFNEYLTEGVGRSKETGLRVFGYDRTSTRAELATMILRVREYKQDPIAYKMVKQQERQEADKKWEQEQQNDKEVKYEYIEINGYKINKEHKYIVTHKGGDIGDGLYLDIGLRAPYDMEERKIAVRDAIASKFGAEIADKALEIIRKKDGEYTDVPITEIRVSKDYKLISVGPGEYGTEFDYYIISLKSLNGDPYVNVSIFAPNK